MTIICMNLSVRSTQAITDDWAVHHMCEIWMDVMISTCWSNV